MTIYEEYKKFWRRLSKEERQALSSHGFDPMQPEDAGVPKPHRYFWNDGDAGDIGSDNGYDVGYLQAVRFLQKPCEEHEAVNDRTYGRDEVLDILSKVLSVMTDCNDAGVRLQGTCIKLALGMPGQPTMTQLAADHSLTRAAVSLRVKTIQRRLGLPPSVYMKSEHACKKLSKARKGK